MTYPDDHLRIRAGWLIDGSGGPIQSDMILEVRQGRITSLHPGREGSVSAGKKATGLHPQDRLLDLSHSTLLPGLVDSHVHLFMSGTSDQLIREGQLTAGYEVARKEMRRHLNQHLTSGVVAVRDGGDRHGHALRLKNNDEMGSASHMRLHVAGRAWNKPGRYGGLIGTPLPAEHLPGQVIATAPKGIDHIKLVNSGLNSLKEFGRQTAPQFSADELAAFVSAATERGLPVMVHANGVEPVAMAVSAGCRSVEHGFFMGYDNLGRMSDRRTTWVPTTITMQAYAQGLSPGGIRQDTARRNCDHQLTQLCHARHLGVTVAVGTDAGSLGVHHGRAVRREIALLHTAGYTLSEAIRCATFNGAQLLGLKTSGLLAKDFEATFIAVEGPPERLPESLEQIQALYIKGKTVPFPAPQPE